MNKKKIWQVLAVCVLLLFFGACAEMTGKSLDEKNRIIRGSPGSGKQSVDLELDAGTVLKNYNYELTVPAEKVNEKMAKEYFRKAEEEIDKDFFTDGEKADYVTDSVHMRESYADKMVKAEWTLDSYQYVDIDGKIQSKNIGKDGNLVKASVELSCGSYRENYAFSFQVYPKKLSEKEQILKDISAAVEKQCDQEGSKYLKLPEKAGGIALKWKEKKQHLVLKILFFEILILVLLTLTAAERKRTEEKNRKDQMLLDYSEIVSKLLILLGSGMSLEQAWNRISAQYHDKRQKKEIPKRAIYEEMVITNYEIMDGESVKRAYQKFAERVDVGSYQRLIRILLQNLQTVSRGLCQLLEQEAESALEEKKALARKLGEEAGTRMLMPLMLMLGIVIAIIMVPAMMSFRL